MHLFIVAALLLCLLVRPVSDSALGLAVACAAAIFSVISLDSWLIYIAASQVIDDPALSPLTLAQLAVAAWFASAAFRRHRIRVASLVPFLTYVGPLVIWWQLCQLVNTHGVPAVLVSAAMTGAITYWFLVTANRPTLRRACACLGIGLFYAVAGYWGLTLGLPVQSVSILARIQSNAFMARLATGRGDVNTLGANIAILMVVAIALLVAPARKRNRHVSAGLVAIIVLSIPALAATVSRGAMITAGAASAAVFAMFLAQRETRRRATVALLAGILASVIALVAVPQLRQGISNIAGQIEERNRYNEGIIGGNSLVAGRKAAWDAHFRAMLRYPITGIYFGEYYDFGEYGVGFFAVDTPGGESHNAFLQFGSSSGVLGFVLFALLFFRAPIRLWRTAPVFEAAPLLGIMVGCMFTFMSLSVITWKLYWAALAMCIYFARLSEHSLCLAMRQRALHRPFLSFTSPVSR